MSTATLNSRKAPYIDCIRVFAILMVILLHCIHTYISAETNFGSSWWWAAGYANELARTGVPLFFMISGYLLISSEGASDIKSFYKRRFQKVLPAFLIYSVFYYAGYQIYYGESLSISAFLSALFYEGTHYHLWFMYSLMMLYLFVPFLKLILDRCSLKFSLLFLLLTIFPSTLRPFMNIILDGKFTIYLSNDGFSGYMGYMILGYILGKYSFAPRVRGIIYALAVLGIVIFPFWNLQTTLNGNLQFFFDGGYTINHYLISTGIFLLCKYNLPDKSIGFGRLAPLCFHAYLIHAFILDLLEKLLQPLSAWIYMTLLFLLTVLTSFLWAGIIKQSLATIKKLSL